MYARLLCIAGLFAVRLVDAAPAPSPTPTQAVCTASLKPNSQPKNCGFKGVLQKPDLINAAKANSLEACRDRCLTNSACKSFGFDSTTRKCAQYAKKLGSQGQHKEPSDTQFFDSACYTATFYSTGNAFYNGGFENELDGWVVSNNEAPVSDTTLATRGPKNPYMASMYVNGTDGDDPYGCTTALILGPQATVCPGVPYTFSFEYTQEHATVTSTDRGGQLSYAAFHFMGFGGSSGLIDGSIDFYGGTVSDSLGNAQGVWHKITGTVTPQYSDYNLQVVLHGYNNVPVTVDVDSFKLVPASSLA